MGKKYKLNSCQLFTVLFYSLKLNPPIQQMVPFTQIKVQFSVNGFKMFLKSSNNK